MTSAQTPAGGLATPGTDNDRCNGYIHNDSTADADADARPIPMTAAVAFMTRRELETMADRHAGCLPTCDRRRVALNELVRRVVAERYAAGERPR